MQISKRDLTERLELIAVFSFTLPDNPDSRYTVTERLVDRHQEINEDAFLSVKNVMGELHRHFMLGHQRYYRALSGTSWQRWRNRKEISRIKREMSLSLHDFTERFVDMVLLPDRMIIPMLLKRDDSLFVLTCNNPLREMAVTLSPVTLYGVEIADYDTTTNEALVSYETSHGTLTPLYEVTSSHEVPTHSLSKRWFTSKAAAQAAASELLSAMTLNDVSDESM